MGGRDHSEECDVCHQERGGLNDVPCACDVPDLRSCDFTSDGCSDPACDYCYGSGPSAYALTVDDINTNYALKLLGQNLSAAAMLCAVWQSTFRNSVEWHRGNEVLWRPGCGRTQP